VDAAHHRLRGALLDDLEGLDWPDEHQGTMQRDWIGRSEGAEVASPSRARAGEWSTVFTTRPDTLFGATYMVLAPEHALVAQITTDAQRAAVEAYVRPRAQERPRPHGEPRRRPASSPAPSPSTRSTAQRIPVWIADYVLGGYGTGAIMAVPAHDERDFEFAKASSACPSSRWSA
jgi:leucyl-tRNA synthetase